MLCRLSLCASVACGWSKMTSRRAAVLPVDHPELEGDDKSDEASCSLLPAEQNRSVGLSSLI